MVATPDEIRNRRQRLEGEIERIAAEPFRPTLVELFYGGDEEAARTAAVAGFVRHSAYWCDGCQHVFEEGDVVYRRKRSDWLRAYCRDCVSKWHPSWLEHASEPVPCPGGCGVLVSHWRVRWGTTISMTCSTRCTEHARNARRRKPTSPIACAGCGETFTPPRANARYCSAGCRQSAHRARKRNA